MKGVGVLRFGKKDFFVSRVLVVLFGLLVAAFTVGESLWAWFRDEPLKVELPLDERVLDLGGVAATVSRATVILGDPTRAQRLVELGLSLLVVLLVVLALGLLWGVVRSAEEGQPFGRGGVMRLRLLSALALLGPFAHVQAAGFANAWFLRQVPGQREMVWVVLLDPVIPFAVIGLAAFLAMLAEVFAKGVRLESDVEGLV